MMAKDLIKTVKGLYEMRDEMGLPHESFDICCSLIEALKPDLEAELDELGAHHNMTLPWVVTPWGRAPWLKDDEDIADLDTKKRAMERYANKAMHRN